MTTLFEFRRDWPSIAYLGALSAPLALRVQVSLGTFIAVGLGLNVLGYWMVFRRRRIEREKRGAPWGAPLPGSSRFLLDRRRWIFEDQAAFAAGALILGWVMAAEPSTTPASLVAPLVVGLLGLGLIVSQGQRVFGRQGRVRRCGYAAKGYFSRCPYCHFDLIGLTAYTCPECGENISDVRERAT